LILSGIIPLDALKGRRHPHRSRPIVDFEVFVPLKLRRVLAELLTDRVAHRVLDVLDAIIIMMNVVGAQFLNVRNAPSKFLDRRVNLSDRFELTNLRRVRRLSRSSWRHLLVLLGGLHGRRFNLPAAFGIIMIPQLG
jgi:hypothetical protein